MPLALLKRADGVEATWSSKGDEVCITVAIDKATRRNGPNLPTAILFLRNVRVMCELLTYILLPQTSRAK